MRWLRGEEKRKRKRRAKRERNRMKRNSGERSVDARADCSRGAACLLAHLPVLNLYVVSATGSAIPLSHWRASPGRGRGRVPRYRLRKGNENRADRRRSAERERRTRVQGEIYLPGRAAVAKSSQGVGQTNDRGASTALRTQEPAILTYL